jgi:hypothetical protein
MGGAATWASGRPQCNALLNNEPSGSAQITHPFHPLRGQQFLVLKTRRVSGRQTLILQGSPQATFAVAADWTDWPAAEPAECSNTILAADALQTLALLVAQLTDAPAGAAQKKLAK